MNKKPLIFLTVLITSIIIVVIVFNYFFQPSYKILIDQKCSEPILQKDWIDNYSLDKCFFVQQNRFYSSSNTYPQEFNNLVREVKVLTLLQSSVGNTKIKDFIEKLKGYNIFIDKSSLDYLDEEINSSSSMLNLYTNKRGDIILIHDKDIIKGIFVDAYQFGNTDDERNKINSFILSHRNTLGEQEVQYIDQLYNNISIDFYFDKGLGFAPQHFIILPIKSRS